MPKRNEIYKCRAYLYIQYWILEKTQTKIAEENNCSRPTISNWLRFFNIEIKSLSDVHKGREKSKEHIQKIVQSRKGYKHSEETKRKISLANKGEKHPNWKPKIMKNCTWCNKKMYIYPFKAKQSNNFCSKKCVYKYFGTINGKNHPLYGKITWIKGKHHSEETKRKLSEAKKGDKNPMWKGGITSEKNKFYSSKEWKKARKIIYKRDNYICQHCRRKLTFTQFNKSSPRVHHIIGIECKILRLVLSNLILLCSKCHLFIHSKKNKTKKYILKTTQENIETMLKIQKTNTLLEFMYALV